MYYGFRNTAKILVYSDVNEEVDILSQIVDASLSQGSRHGLDGTVPRVCHRLPLDQTAIFVLKDFLLKGFVLTDFVLTYFALT
jgi:hypothetical protein